MNHSFSSFLIWKKSKTSSVNKKQLLVKKLLFCCLFVSYTACCCLFAVPWRLWLTACLTVFACCLPLFVFATLTPHLLPPLLRASSPLRLRSALRFCPPTSLRRPLILGFCLDPPRFDPKPLKIFPQIPSIYLKTSLICLKIPSVCLNLRQIRQNAIAERSKTVFCLAERASRGILARLLFERHPWGWPRDSARNVSRETMGIAYSSRFFTLFWVFFVGFYEILRPFSRFCGRSPSFLGFLRADR